MIIGISGYIGSGKDTVGNIWQWLSHKKMFPGDVSLEEFSIRKFYSGWEIKKFAGKLKQIASILTNIPAEKFEDQDFKRTALGPEWNIPMEIWMEGERRPDLEALNSVMTVRIFMQRLGLNAFRDRLHPDTWVNALFSEYISRKIGNSKATQYGIRWRDTETYKIEVTPENNPEYFMDLYPNWLITDMRFPNEVAAIKDRDGVIIRVNRPGIIPDGHGSEGAIDDYIFDYVIVNDGSIEDLIKKVEDIWKQIW